jgi:Family of unknown function (DUF6152)
MKTQLKLLLASVLITLTFPAAAHHSFYAEFDQNKEVTLAGTVIKMEWVNPHSWLHIAVVNAQGETEEWKVEGGSPAVLLRLGWNKNSLPAGTKVTVKGFQSKDGARRANTRSIEFPDGRTMEMGSSGREEKK